MQTEVMVVDGLGSGPAHGPGLGIIVFRVWVETNDDQLRGRLIAPDLKESTAAVGTSALLALFERALSAIGRDLRAVGDAIETPD